MASKKSQMRTISFSDFWNRGIVCLRAGPKLGQSANLLPRFLPKNGNKREKEAVVWSGSSWISCLQGVPTEEGTKGNALKRERGLSLLSSFLTPLGNNKNLQHLRVKIFYERHLIRIHIWDLYRQELRLFASLSGTRGQRSQSCGSCNSTMREEGRMGLC